MTRKNCIFAALMMMAVVCLAVFVFLKEETPATQPQAAQAVQTAQTAQTAQTVQSTQAVQSAQAAQTPEISMAEQFYNLTKFDKYEMRGVWIATVLNIDMPNAMSEETFTKWASETCQAALDKKLNTIVFQVKPTADALYKSSLAPWSSYITGGKQGIDPGFDPLQIMLDEAHGRGIELHAWINPYRVTMASGKLADLAPDNPAVKNPSWVIGYGNQFFLNPGLPEVQQYLLDSVAEIVQNYDVDAIHMDDYFYPYPVAGTPFPDSDAFQKYGSLFETVAEWRRSNVNTLVAGIYAKIKEIKPHVQYGISPFGVWRNIANDPTGSATKAGVENYDSLHADTRQWLIDGSIDYLAPQIYWSRISTAANYTVLIDWWNAEVLKYTESSHPVNLYVGLADYKVGTNNDASWESTNVEISGQITDNYQKQAITGQMHYNFSSVMKNTALYFDNVNANNYKHLALTPPSPWNGTQKAALPSYVSAKVQSDGILVTIGNAVTAEGDTETELARKFVVYRFVKGAAPQYTSANIAGVVYNGENPQFLDKHVSKATEYVYSVKSLSGSGIESDMAVNSNMAQF